MPVLVIVGAIVLTSFAIQTVSGFGAMIVALALGSHLVDIQVLIAWVIPLSMISCGYIAIRYRGHIEWRLLGLWIAPWMGLGLAGGIAAKHALASEALQLGFAIFVLVLAVWELYLRFRSGHIDRRLHVAVRVLFLIGAGVMHGIYATGGPMLVYVLGRMNLEKSAFRTTLMVVWIAFNVVLIADYARVGMLGFESAYLLPAVVAGVVVGEVLHARVDHRRFELIVFGLLAVSGALMIVMNLR